MSKVQDSTGSEYSLLFANHNDGPSHSEKVELCPHELF